MLISLRVCGGNCCKSVKTICPSPWLHFCNIHCRLDDFTKLFFFLRNAILNKLLGIKYDFFTVLFNNVLGPEYQERGKLMGSRERF